METIQAQKELRKLVKNHPEIFLFTNLKKCIFEQIGTNGLPNSGRAAFLLHHGELCGTDKETIQCVFRRSLEFPIPPEAKKFPCGCKVSGIMFPIDLEGFHTEEAFNAALKKLHDLDK